jgi:uncharacterized protein
VTPIRRRLRRHPVATYLALTFTISWGAILLLAGGMPGPTTPDTALPLALVAMFAGPAVAGPLTTGLVSGKAGIRELRARLVSWRVSIRWYAFALLVGPFAVFASLLMLTPFSRAYLPGILTTDDPLSLLLFALAVALPTAFFEELGWTGFATPRLRRRHGVFATGVALAVAWGVWHYPVNVWGSAAASGTVPTALFLLVVLFSFLPPYRILMVWVYDRTQSALVVMVMHASLVTFWLMATPGVVGTPDAIAGRDMVAWYLVWAALLWVVVAIVALARRRTGGQVQQGAPRRQLEGREAVPTRVPSTQGASRG